MLFTFLDSVSLQTNYTSVWAYPKHGMNSFHRSVSAVTLSVTPVSSTGQSTVPVTTCRIRFGDVLTDHTTDF